MSKIILLIVLFVPLSVIADTEVPNLNPKVIEALNVYTQAAVTANASLDKTLNDARPDRDGKIDAAKVNLTLSLEEIQAQLTKAGELEKAVQVREFLVKVKTSSEQIESKIVHVELRAAVRSHNNDVAKATNEYDQVEKIAAAKKATAITSARVVLLQELEKIKAEVAAAGDLDGALDIRRLINEIRSKKESRSLPAAQQPPVAAPSDDRPTATKKEVQAVRIATQFPNETELKKLFTVGKMEDRGVGSRLEKAGLRLNGLMKIVTQERFTGDVKIEIKYTLSSPNQFHNKLIVDAWGVELDTKAGGSHTIIVQRKDNEIVMAVDDRPVHRVLIKDDMAPRPSAISVKLWHHWQYSGWPSVVIHSIRISGTAAGE